MCPEFSYVLSCRKSFTLCTPNGAGAGVIDLQRFIRSDVCKDDLENLFALSEPPPPYELLVDYIASTYTYSVYPTSAFIREFLLQPVIRRRCPTGRGSPRSGRRPRRRVGTLAVRRRGPRTAA